MTETQFEQYQKAARQIGRDEAFREMREFAEELLKSSARYDDTRQAKLMIDFCNSRLLLGDSAIR